MFKKSDVKDIYSLSPMQEGMLFHYLMDRTSTAYFEQTCYRVSGEIDKVLFERAFNHLIQRYDVLRTIFIYKASQKPRQVLLKQRKAVVHFEDLSPLPENEKEIRVKEFKQKDKTVGFNLARDILIRFALLKRGERYYEVIFSFPHVIMDGWCTTILLKEMMVIYTGLKKGTMPALPPVVPYRAYIKWLEKQDKKVGLHYWENYLKDYENRVLIPGGKETNEKNRQIKNHFFQFDPGLTAAITRTAREREITVNTFLQTLWGILLQKYNNTTDVVFGAVVSGRSARVPGIETMVGLFINTIPMRIRNKPDAAFAGVLKQVQQDSVRANNYEYIPLAEIQALNPLKRDLVNHIMVFENYPIDKEVKNISQNQDIGFTVQGIDFFDQTHYDIDIEVSLIHRLTVNIIYNSICYDDVIIGNIGKHLARMMEQVTAVPAIPVNRLEIISRQEKEQILYEFNGMKRDFPRDKTIHRLFEEQVVQHPGKIALEFKDPDTTSGAHFITYSHLNQRANQLAVYLANQGIARDGLVGIMLHRSPGMVESILATWKAGGAYIPIDPQYPEQRIIEILKDSQSQCLITLTQHTIPQLPKTCPRVFILLDTCPDTKSEINTPNPDTHIDTRGMAYVIYTSGSTGKPKGAVLEHIGMMNHMQAKINDLQITAKSIVAQNASHTFDISVWQFFAAVIAGGKTIIYPHSLVIAPGRFVARAAADGITILQVVPSYLSVILNTIELNPVDFKSLEYLVVTGETVNPGLVEQWFKQYPGIKMVNAYGPTEASDDITHYLMTTPPPTPRIPIGTPLQNLDIYIVDEHMNLCPAGVKGEICVSGIGVGKGYLNNPELTAKRFNRSYRSYKTYIFRTGDLARWLPDGTIDFYGRNDLQVKIRGYRIELAEIERVLSNHREINEAVVTVRQDQEQGKYLCGYITGNSNRYLDAPGIAGIKKFLADRLPDYMIPTYILQLEKLPLTPNGKVDRKSLPDPQKHAQTQQNKKYLTPLPPLNKTQEKLLETWKEVLGPGLHKSIDIEDNFFELGGHSLTVMLLASRIHKQFNKEIPLPDIFNHPTIKELSDYIEKSPGDIYVAIQPVEKRSFYPVSSAQNRLFVLQQMALSSVAYNIPEIVVLEEEPDLDRLERTFKQLIQCHQSLRTSFHIIAGYPVQRIHREVEFKIEDYQAEEDRSSVNRKRFEGTRGLAPLSNEPAAALISSFIRPFDLSKAPLLRVGLIKLPHTPTALRGHTSPGGKDDKYILIVDVHHIVSDGYSHLKLTHEFNRLYRGEELLPLRLQYIDFSQWQNQQKQTPVYKQQEVWWLGRLSGELPVPDMPLDYPRPPVYDFEGESINFEIGARETRALEQTARTRSTTLYNLLLALYNILLSKITGQEEIIVGTPVVGRRHADLEPVIGMFVNTLALRNYPSGDKTLIDFLQEVNQQSVEAFENQEYPFDDLVEKITLERDPSRNPVFDTVLSYHDTRDNGETNEPTETRWSYPRAGQYRYENRTSKFDLTLYAFVGENKISCAWQYRTKLFKKETIQRFTGYFHRVISFVLSSPYQQISGIEIISREEKRWILTGLNNTKANYPEDKTIDRLFAEQAGTTPDQIAVIGHHSRSEGTRGLAPLPALASITYRELNQKSNQLALELKEKGVQPDAIVGMIMEPSLEMIVAILAILKAGGAYLPIDPDYPEERIKYMLKDSSARILVSVLSEVSEVSEVSEISEGIEIIDRHKIEFKGDFLTHPTQRTHPTQLNLAYIIYTSGTTGKPKGVMIRHRNVVQLLFNDKTRFDFNHHDIWTMFHSYCFDFSVWEMYGALLYGGRLIIIPRDTARDPRQFLKVLEQHQVTVLNQTPSAFYNLIHRELQDKKRELHLRYVIFGGEDLRPGKLKKWVDKYPGTRLINMFGITETTVHVTYKEITVKEIETDISNIGQPLANTRTYIMDSYLKLLPSGITGELYVGGRGLSRGYLNQPGLTAEKFVRKEPPGKKINTSHLSYMSYIYRTGDRVKLTDNGEMEYCGRKDNQVQIRGHRIELGEIESQLLNHEGIEDVMVAAGQTAETRGTLCAYVVLKKEINLMQLRKYLEQKLPAYMVPNYFVKLEAIPLTANGKVNRKQLPSPGILPGDEGVEPRGPIQAALVETWKEVLNLQSLGITDNYFNLGGDSIKAIRLINAINSRLDSNLKVVDIYFNQTVAELARRLNKEKPADKSSSADEQTQTALEEIHRLKDNLAGLPVSREIETVFPMFNVERGMFFYYLKDTRAAIYHDQAVYTVRIKDFDMHRMKQALTLMLAKHPVLRSAYILDRSIRVVYKLEQIEFEIIHTDLSGKERQEQEARVREYTERSRRNPFKPDQPPQWRLGFFTLNRQTMAVVWEFHHAIIDGWSNASFLTELNNTYKRLETEPGYTPGKLKHTYKEYMAAQLARENQLKNSPGTRKYWKEEMQDYKRLNFPSPPPGTPVQLKKRNMNLGLSFRDQLLSAAGKHNTSIKHLCFAAYIYMLNMLSWENDVTVGLVTNTRPGIEDSDKVLGCFLNTVPVRVKIPGPLKWSQYIRLIDHKLRELKKHDQLSLYEIMAITGEKTRESNPFFDTYFNFIDFFVYGELEGETAEPAEGGDITGLSYEKTNTPLDFGINSTRGYFGIFLDYSTLLISDDTVDNLCYYLKRILAAFIQHPDEPADKEQLLSPRQKQQLLIEFNDTAADYPRDKTIHQLFREQAARTPGNTALVFADTVITYEQLDRYSSRLAHRLRSKGTAPGTAIAIMAERSIEMIIGIYSILQAGSFYLPIAPDSPPDRIKYLLADSGAKILLARISFLEQEPASQYQADYPGQHPCEIINLEPPGSHCSFPEPPLPPGQPNDAAYLIYTSGSTGQPKGVIVEHGSVVNILIALFKKYPLTRTDSYLLKTSYTFDVSVSELFGWHPAGARLAILKPDSEMDPREIIDTARRFHVTHINFVPSMFNAFLKILNPQHIKKILSLKYIFLAGEALSPQLVERFKQLNTRIPLENLYGPTEGTVYSSAYSLQDRDGKGNISIGKPLPNIRLYILDKYARLQPPGIQGELAIAGAGTARGYLNNPELTAEKFCLLRPGAPRRGGPICCANRLCRFSFVSGLGRDMMRNSLLSHIYRTGDLARWLPDGNIEFLGRIDQQVKIRGFRIEPGEIENHLSKHQNIKAAAVIAQQDDSHTGQLYAYIVPGSPGSAGSLSVSLLRDYLSRKLPGYMVPSYFILLEEMPLTPGGKINKTALHSLGTRLGASDKYTPPQTETEKIVAAVWQEVLKVERVGIHDKFLELGGTSLHIVEITAKLKEIINREIPLVKMFQHPTVHSLANYLSQPDSSQQDSFPGPAGEIRSDDDIDKSAALMEKSLEMFLGDDNE
jgi:amino acid adenylation domain-containing protein